MRRYDMNVDQSDSLYADESADGEWVRWEDVARDIAKARALLDNAYQERNQLVAYLASVHPSGTRRTAIEGWDPCWHGCVFVDTPAGQMSWHYHDRDAQLFAALPAYIAPWDGHTTPEKYERLALLSRAPAQTAPESIEQSVLRYERDDAESEAAAEKQKRMAAEATLASVREILDNYGDAGTADINQLRADLEKAQDEMHRSHAQVEKLLRERDAAQDRIRELEPVLEACEAVPEQLLRDEWAPLGLWLGAIAKAELSRRAARGQKGEVHVGE